MVAAEKGLADVTSGTSLASPTANQQLDNTNHTAK